MRVERFLRELYDEAKDAAPDSLFTYVNFPPTEFLDLSFFDVCAFNVYLHREPELRAYLARLQHIAGHKPLLLAEAGADSIREGEDGQAAITAMHVRAAFEEGACGAVAFAWTDEWWRGGHRGRGLGVRARRSRSARPKPARGRGRRGVRRRAVPPEQRDATWPRVSVVVCAYNAADTLDDCLIVARAARPIPTSRSSSSTTARAIATGEIARAHPRVRVIDIPNGGLSAARNVGLADATGEIVAYTDADTRVDPDWLTYLVQPFLTSDVVGSGGPNVVPADDPPMAQCIARAPGRSDARAARRPHRRARARLQHGVPPRGARSRSAASTRSTSAPATMWTCAGGCRRAAGRSASPSSALVWHHHRSSVKAYWRQQVGYGEGERWLMAHHPEKFLDGRMLWRGRIYSPLPFVRSLWGARINAGVWGTAAFPSVYRTDVHPFAFLPHSVRWQVLSFVLDAGRRGRRADRRSRRGRPRCCSAPALVGIAATIAQERRPTRSDPTSTRCPGSRLWYRAVVAYLHFLQPFARMRRPDPRRALAAGSRAAGRRSGRPAAVRGRRCAKRWRALLLLSGSVAEDRFWSEQWTTTERVLSQLTDWLRRRAPSASIEIDEGWSHDRDVSVLVGRWAWLDVARARRGSRRRQGLLRVSTHLRPTSFGIARRARARGGACSRRPAPAWRCAGRPPAPSPRLLAVAVTAFTRLADRPDDGHPAPGVDAVADRARHDGDEVAGRPGVPLVAPSLLRTYGLRSADRSFVVMILALGAGTFMLREAATARRSSARGKGYAGDNGPAIQAWLDTPGGIAVAPTGDVYFADSNNHVIRRIDAAQQRSRRSSATTPSGGGFSGDFGPATQAQLDTPGRRRDRAGRRPASSPTRTTTASAASIGRPARSSRSPARARPATTATTSPPPRRR